MRKNHRKELEWGLVQVIPDESPAGYGARCIQQRDVLDFVWDRQDVFAIDDGHHEALSAVLDRAGFMEHIRDRYSELFRQGKLRPDSSDVEILFEDHAVVVKASTNGSFGYVYLAAYLKPSDDVSNLIGRDHPDYQNWENGSVTRWTYKRLPAIGEVVGSNVNNIGNVRVLRYAAFDGWLQVISIPIDPPDWYRKQNKLGKTWQVCGLVGGEVREAA